MSVDASALATDVDQALEFLAPLFGQPSDETDILAMLQSPFHIRTDGARNSAAASGSGPTAVDADAFAVSLDPAFEFSTPVVQVGQLADGAATYSVSSNIPQRKTIKTDRRPLKVGLSCY